MSRPRNENVDVSMGRKILLRERRWVVESKCFQPCLSWKKTYRVKTRAFTCMTIHLFLFSVCLRRRKIQKSLKCICFLNNFWSGKISIRIRFFHLFFHICEMLRFQITSFRIFWKVHIRRSKMNPFSLFCFILKRNERHSVSKYQKLNKFSLVA